jgi:hypothetical protein
MYCTYIIFRDFRGKTVFALPKYKENKLDFYLDISQKWAQINSPDLKRLDPSIFLLDPDTCRHIRVKAKSRGSEDLILYLYECLTLRIVVFNTAHF